MNQFIFTLIFLFVGSAQADISAQRKYKDVVAYMNQIAQGSPQTARLFMIGTSNDGVAIQGIMIGQGPVSNLVVATHHGNEYASAEVALNFAESIAKAPIAGQTIYVIPVLNINGYDARIREEKVNGQLVDSNRDYPGPCGTNGPFHLGSTQALAQFLQKQKIVTAATIHSFHPTVAYPWGVSTFDLDTEYTSTFQKLAAAATKESRYPTGFASEVLYPVDGSFEDFAFWKYGIWSLLFEVGESHSPTGASLQETVRVNVAGLRNLFEVAPKTLAAKHEFTGTCQPQIGALSRH